MEHLRQIEILLVEDSKTDAELAIRALSKKNLANNIVWVKDGAEALDYLYRTGVYAGRAEGKPRMIFLDLRLPKMSGIEVLRRLKSEPALRTIPVVMMTSSEEEPDIAQCYELGVNSYVVKPVDFSQFVEAVAQAGMYWAVLNRPPT